jgi:hypothetical protein
MLAEKVETKEEFQRARKLGYHYFQGYFFARPVVVSRREIPGVKLTYLRILREIHQPELAFRELESVIQCDVSLASKLLRYVIRQFLDGSARYSPYGRHWLCWASRRSAIGLPWPHSTLWRWTSLMS